MPFDVFTKMFEKKRNGTRQSISCSFSYHLIIDPFLFQRTAQRFLSPSIIFFSLSLSVFASSYRSSLEMYIKPTHMEKLARIKKLITKEPRNRNHLVEPEGEINEFLMGEICQ